MGYFDGDPYPCTGLETPGAVLRLNEDGTPQGNETALNASACFADWYLGPSRWVWREGDPAAPPEPDPASEPEPDPWPASGPPAEEPDEPAQGQ